MTTTIEDLHPHERREMTARHYARLLASCPVHLREQVGRLIDSQAAYQEARARGASRSEAAGVARAELRASSQLAQIQADMATPRRRAEPKVTAGSNSPPPEPPAKTPMQICRDVMAMHFSPEELEGFRERKMSAADIDAYRKLRDAQRARSPR